MAQTYILGKDRNNIPVYLSPAGEALARTVDTTISTATSITLNEATTFLEINATNGGVYLRYSADCSASNFDEFIQEGQTRHYIVPVYCTVISVLEASSGAGVVVIEK